MKIAILGALRRIPSNNPQGKATQSIEVAKLLSTQTCQFIILHSLICIVLKPQEFANVPPPSRNVIKQEVTASGSLTSKRF